MLRLRACSGVVSALGLVVLAGPAVAQSGRSEAEVYAATGPALNKLMAAKDYPAVLAGIGQYVKQFPADSRYQRGIVGYIGSVFSLGYREPVKTRELGEWILKEFADVPTLYAAGAQQLANSYIDQPDAKLRDLDKGLAIADAALKHLGDKFTPTWVFDRNLLVCRIGAFYYAHKYPEALAAERQAAETAPLLLEDQSFLWIVFCTARLGQTPDKLLPAAKLLFSLCAFQEGAINQAIEAVSQALSVDGGPGVGLQFAKSQQTPGGTNALRDVKLIDIGDPAVMKKAAGDDAQALFDIALYTGDLAQATAKAKEQMKNSAAQPALLALAMKNLARCFKAHNGSVARANLFLKFHSTGEGDNPLPAFEAELAK